MSIATDTPGDIDTRAELEAARQAHAELLDRIDADVAVTPLELAESEAAVRLAEERIALLERRAAEAAEQRRLALVATVLKDLRSGSVHTKAQAVVDAYDAAVAALVVLRDAGDAYNVAVDGAVRQLQGQGPYPPELDVSFGGHTRRVTLDDVTHIVATNRSHLLVGRAARAAARTLNGLPGEWVRAGVDQLSMDPLAPIRRAVAEWSDPR